MFMKTALSKSYSSGVEHPPCNLLEEVFLYIDVSTVEPTMRVNWPCPGPAWGLTQAGRIANLFHLDN